MRTAPQGRELGFAPSRPESAPLALMGRAVQYAFFVHAGIAFSQTMPRSRNFHSELWCGHPGNNRVPALFVAREIQPVPWELRHPYSSCQHIYHIIYNMICLFSWCLESGSEVPGFLRFGIQAPQESRHPRNPGTPGIQAPPESRHPRDPGTPGIQAPPESRHGIQVSFLAPGIQVSRSPGIPLLYGCTHPGSPGCVQKQRWVPGNQAPL